MKMSSFNSFEENVCVNLPNKWELGSGRVRVPCWLSGILGYVGYFRVFWYLREYPKYMVIPDILCCRIPSDFQNWIGSGIYKNVGYWEPAGPFPWVNFWRICVLDRGANWHLRCFGPPPIKTKPPSKLEARPDEWISWKNSSGWLVGFFHFDTETYFSALL